MYIKCLSIINSCITLEQLGTAEKYIDLARRGNYLDHNEYQLVMDHFFDKFDTL